MTDNIKALREALNRLSLATTAKENLDEDVQTLSVALDQLEAAEKDAERYRWLKRHHLGELLDIFFVSRYNWNEHDVSNAIDAMKEKQP